MGEFSKALVLTTPHIRDKGDKGRVHDAQYLMQGHSVFGEGLACYKDQPRDGDFGPIAAQAAGRTKFWLGYNLKNCTNTFGQELYDLLVGKSALTKSMKANRTVRLKAVSPGQKALQFLRQFDGYHEHPAYSNETIFGEWYRFNGVPWCAIFESYGFAHTGRPSYHYAAVEAIYYDALAGRNGLRQVWTPKYGDIALYSEHGTRFAHTAFYVSRVTSNTFKDFGGNTGPSSMSNGGAVMEQLRSTSLVLAYVRAG
jgi:hypothetical protein